MEASVAVQLFKDAVASGVSYSTYFGDDNSTTENHLKTLVNYEIEKWSNINHSCRALGLCLYSAKPKVKGLTLVVIGYVQQCFTYCIKYNEGDPSALLRLSAIVPHAFGEHEKCKKWCRYNEDPVNYQHNDPRGKRSQRNRSARKPFLFEEAARKLAPVGSSQCNECLHSVVGSKAPRIRHYSGSEKSDFRTAAGVSVQ